MANLGKLEKVNLRTAWMDEGAHFTPWLAKAENLQLLGDTLGMQLELVEQERAVGPFRADILCRDALEHTLVLIENQLQRTDHSHLGQILTYAAGLEAATVIWVAGSFTDEHRAALDWLNEITGEEFSFFGLEVELWRIGDSPAAPKFNIVSKPNDWTKGGYRSRAGKLTDYQQLQLEFWTAFKEYMTGHSEIKCSKPYPQNWMWHTMGRPGYRLASVASLWDSETGVKNPETRVELTLDDDNSGAYFDLLEKQKSEIEREIGQPLTWYSKEGVRTRRIYIRRKADLFDRKKWPGFFDWLSTNLELFNKVFGPRMDALQPPGAEQSAPTR